MINSPWKLHESIARNYSHHATRLQRFDVLDAERTYRMKAFCANLSVCGFSTPNRACASRSVSSVHCRDSVIYLDTDFIKYPESRGVLKKKWIVLSILLPNSKKSCIFAL